MIPTIKYDLHYDDVRGDFLRPPHGTTDFNNCMLGWMIKAAAVCASNILFLIFLLLKR